MRYWLLKSEPDVFSFADLKRSPGRKTVWDGVRNYQARNLLREMKKGDLCLFYESRVEPMAVAGVCKVVEEAHPDPTQFDPKSPYHDPNSDPDDPRWVAVGVRYEEDLPRRVTLKEMRTVPGLAGMKLLQRGMRLSVQPVTKREFERILRLGNT